MSNSCTSTLFSPGQTTLTTGRGTQPAHEYFMLWAMSADADSGHDGLTVKEILAKVQAYHRQYVNSTRHHRPPVLDQPLAVAHLQPK